MYSPNNVYIIEGNGFLWNAKRINYYLNYSTLKIDSFLIENLKPKDSDWQKFISSLSIDKIWTIQPLSEINNKYGCVDGETVRIDVADKTRFKILSYKCYTLYFNEPSYSYCKLLVERIKELER